MGDSGTIGKSSSFLIRVIFLFKNDSSFFFPFLDLEKFKNAVVHVESQISELALSYVSLKSKRKIETEDAHLEAVSRQILFKSIETGNINTGY